MKEIPGKNLTEDPFQRLDLRVELETLDAMISELKILYEQYFSGILSLAPDPEHNNLKRKMRQLRKAPFKSSEMGFKLKVTENRYSTLNTYWQRVLREREQGTYSRDVFKAQIREKQAQQEAKDQTVVGKAERAMEGLFGAYKNALENQSGKKIDIDYQAFEKSLLARAKDFKEKHGVTKLSFKIVVKEGKVTVQAKPKT